MMRSELTGFFTHLNKRSVFIPRRNAIAMHGQDASVFIY